MTVIDLVSLHYQNLVGTKKRFELADSEFLISLTTHGTRVRWSHFSIESLIRSGVPEGSIYLWLPTGASKTKALRRLQSRGVNIYIVPDVRSHTKWAYLRDLAVPKQPLGFILVDDDLIYPRWWFMELIVRARTSPRAAWVHLFSRLSIEDGVLSFRSWPQAEHDAFADSPPHPLNHPFSGSGLFIPFEAIQLIDSNPQRFLTICPTSDDIWLHRELVRNGILIGATGCMLEMPPSNPLMGSTGLHELNWGAGGNAKQLRAAFDCLTDELDLLERP